MPKQVTNAVKPPAHPPPEAHRSQPIDPLPSSIELSPVQQEILDLIIQDQTSIQGPVQPERVILLWSDGVSESATARELGISQEDVRSLRHRWLASARRIVAAENKLQQVFSGLVSLIFRIPNEEPFPSATPTSRKGIPQTSSAGAGGSPTVASELRPATRALIEILHHKPSAYEINRSNWTQARSLSEN